MESYAFLLLNSLIYKPWKETETTTETKAGAGKRIKMSWASSWNWLSFRDLPEDAVFSILSFLSPAEMGALACTSKLLRLWLSRNQNKIWFFMCDRRWGSKTEIKRWGCGQTCYKKLYSSLSKCERLIGFWMTYAPSLKVPRLMVVEWGPSSVTGHRVISLRDGTHRARKVAFLWVGVDEVGELVSCGQLGFPKEELCEVSLGLGPGKRCILKIESCGEADSMSFRVRAGAGAEEEGEMGDGIEVVYGVVPEDGMEVDEQYLALADALSKHVKLYFLGDPPLQWEWKNPIGTRRELFRRIEDDEWWPTPPIGRWKRPRPRELLLFPRLRRRHQAHDHQSS